MPHNRVQSTSSQLSERHTLKEVKSVNSAPHGTDSLDLISRVSLPFTLTRREVWLIVIIWCLPSYRSAVPRKCANLFVCIWKMCPALTDGFGSPCRLMDYNGICFVTLRGPHPEIDRETPPHVYSTGNVQYRHTLPPQWNVHTQGWLFSPCLHINNTYACRILRLCVQNKKKTEMPLWITNAHWQYD